VVAVMVFYFENGKNKNYHCSRMKSYLKLSLLFVSLFIFMNGYSQICLQIEEGPKRVVVNTDHVTKVKVLNVPTGASVKIWANKERVYSFNGEAVLKYTDSIISYHVVEIDVRVELNKKIIFSENRATEFVYFKPDIALQIKGSEYVYKGINTEFNLCIAGSANQDLVITGYGFPLTKLGSSHYRTFINDARSEVKMGFGIKTMEDSFLNLEKKTIKIYDLPRPNFDLSRSVDSVLLSDTMIGIRTLIPPDLMGRVQPQIQNFTVQIWSTTGVQNFSSNGSEIKGELLAAIKKMKSGDLLYFKNIQFKWHDKQAETMLINTFAFSKN